MGLGDTGRRVPALQTWTWKNVAFAFVLRRSHGLRQWLHKSYAALWPPTHSSLCFSSYLTVSTALHSHAPSCSPQPGRGPEGISLRAPCSLSTPYQPLCQRQSFQMEAVKSFGFIISSSEACLPLRSGGLACPSKVRNSVPDTVFHRLLQYL